ncbi:NAD(P)H-hydrate epimerase [Legionella pneumophila]|uniref:NAD(P)H-hydrate epimerase n=1 Tax=Legionella pneumophila TaxID=446 RepID=UPI001EDFC8F8|nr:NAD(P)H-hydrate epimerase [Legionella pneumophila]
MKTPIYLVTQFQQLMDLMQNQYQVSCLELMQRSGNAACDFLMHRWPKVKKISIFCGRGDNGGQGYVLAQQAKKMGMNPTVWQVGHQLSKSKPPQMHKEVWHEMNSCHHQGIVLHPYSPDIDLGNPELIVDALFGVGLCGHVRPEIASLLQRLQQFTVPILAIEVPTGINASTGEIAGNALAATATITFLCMKLGLLINDGRIYSGEVAFDDLLAPETIYQQVKGIEEPDLLDNSTGFPKKIWCRNKTQKVWQFGID